MLGTPSLIGAVQNVEFLFRSIEIVWWDGARTGAMIGAVAGLIAGIVCGAMLAKVLEKRQ